ncbi:hypothetical protein MMC10_008684 [Thelotrema lepadinum]|nr:hypothetical protein [Thelotrema lepadinum]
MSAPLGKRRKLNNNSALSKPFKSPVRKAQDGENHSHVNDPKTETSRLELLPNESELVEAKPVRQISTRHALGRVATTDSTVAPEVSALKRHHTALLSRLSGLRVELDKVKQALKIEASPRDKELERLIQQWRAASQQAAEEVYADVRDRVNGMGGLRAWQDQQKQRTEGNWGWDEGKNESQEENDERDERESVEAETKTPEDDESESFTMDMMLRSLNIELDVIHYDKAGHRWMD